VKNQGLNAREMLSNGIAFYGTIGVAILIGYITFLRSQLRAATMDVKNKSNRISDLEKDMSAQHNQIRVLNEDKGKLEANVEGLTFLLNENFKAFPWLRRAYVEYEDLLARQASNWLYTKSHPARKAGELVREFRKKAKASEVLYRRLVYRQEYCERLFPWLSELFDEDIESLLLLSEAAPSDTNSDAETEIKSDPTRNFMSKEEYLSLSTTDRNQLALDRYISNKKSNWQIGREFERFAGYCFEQDGYDVVYHGAVEGFEDLGRDLIATKDKEVLVVQCKFWSTHKKIHEKHIYQLYGTFCDYVISNNLGRDSTQNELFGERAAFNNSTPLFLTTAKLSDRAIEAARLLGVKYELAPMEKWKYPRIKCNISKRTGEKIYHLPFDQQYDRIKIEPQDGEFYAMTCKEAEDRGFRRAWRWVES
jgi:hypothetical protein